MLIQVSADSDRRVTTYSRDCAGVERDGAQLVWSMAAPLKFRPGLEITAESFQPYFNDLITIPEGSHWRVTGMHHPQEDASYNLPPHADQSRWRIRIERQDAAKPGSGNWTPQIVAITPEELGAYFVETTDEEDEDAWSQVMGMPGEALPPGPLEDPNEFDSMTLFGDERTQPTQPAFAPGRAQQTSRDRLPSNQRPTVGPPSPRAQAMWRGVSSVAETARQYLDSSTQPARPLSLDSGGRGNRDRRRVNHRVAQQGEALFKVELASSNSSSLAASPPENCHLIVPESRLVELGLRQASADLWLGPPTLSRKGTMRLKARRWN